MRDKVDFIDILLPRNTHFGIIKFMTRQWAPKKTLNYERDYSPQDVKNLVSKSVYLDSYLEAESVISGIQKEQLRKEILKYLDEIAMDKRMHVIRWMGVFFLKVSFMMKIGIFVNEPVVLKLKESMGENPVLFLPTHRSYADFCVLTYLCYHYDIELPAVAAGMDFYTMAVVGQMMRETGAFYMRRSLVGAPLYAAALRQYVRTLLARYGAPVEFFLEGTRSRSNKSLPPKYGMLAMSLVPYFAREVDDVTIVPVNISYDRIMEQSLFAYEHLGVPKPKETTGGLLKALRSLNDHFGNIYINLGAPMSLKKYLGNTALTPDTLKPRELQQLTDDESKLVQDVADHVVTLQQDSTVVTATNLISIVLMQCVYRSQALGLEDVVAEVDWLIEVLGGLGATVFEKDVRGGLHRVTLVHGRMLRMDRDKKLRLVSTALMDVNAEVQKKMKGHKLKAETMVHAVPIIQLQLYINPVLHYLAPPALLYLIVQRASIDRDNLYAEYSRVRKLLRHEFFHLEENEVSTFERALEYCTSRRVVFTDGVTVTRGDNGRLQYLLQWAVLPALTTLLACMEVMDECKRCEHKEALRRVQQLVEGRAQHPYCLSLDAGANCLQGLVLAAALGRHKREQEVVYEVEPDVMQQCRQLVSSILPKLSLVVDNNPVIVQNSPRAHL